MMVISPHKVRGTPECVCRKCFSYRCGTSTGLCCCVPECVRGFPAILLHAGSHKHPVCCGVCSSPRPDSCRIHTEPVSWIRPGFDLDQGWTILLKTGSHSTSRPSAGRTVTRGPAWASEIQFGGGPVRSHHAHHPPAVSCLHRTEPATGLRLHFNDQRGGRAKSLDLLRLAEPLCLLSWESRKKQTVAAACCFSVFVYVSVDGTLLHIHVSALPLFCVLVPIYELMKRVVLIDLPNHCH